jgi:hypothetical protein
VLRRQPATSDLPPIRPARSAGPVSTASRARRRPARWPALAGLAVLARACAACGTTDAPPPLGQRTRGPILNVVTSEYLNGSQPRGVSQYFAVRTRTIYASVMVGDLHGATQAVITWSRLTARGPQKLFSRELPVTNYGLAYLTAVTPGTIPVGTYQVSASVDGETRSVDWTVFTPPQTTAANFSRSAAALRPGSSGSFPQQIPNVPCTQMDSSVSMPSTTDVRLILSAYCPQDNRNGPSRGVVIATMKRTAGEWLVGALHLEHDGMLTGSFRLNLCQLPGGSNEPEGAFFYSSIIYYRGISRNFSGEFLLPPAHLAPAVTIRSSVPAGSAVRPGQKIVLDVTAAEPTSLGPELAIGSITVTGPAGHVVEARKYSARPSRCDAGRLSRTLRVTYTVPAGAAGPLTLTAASAGLPGPPGTASVSFRVRG